MSETENRPGIIGQKYEERKSHKVGTLVGHDTEKLKMLMCDADGAEFSISYSSFKSNWRKVATETTEALTSTESADESVEVTETAQNTEATETVTEEVESEVEIENVMDEKLSVLISNINNADITATETTVSILSDMPVLCIDAYTDKLLKIRMHPEAYYLSSLCELKLDNFRVGVSEDGLSTSFVVHNVALSSIISRCSDGFVEMIEKYTRLRNEETTDINTTESEEN